MKIVNSFGIMTIMMFVLLTSCKTQMVSKSPQEVKLMTSRQFEVDKDLVYKSAISLIQSESYLISETDKDVGLINASKRLENANAKKQQFWFGSSKDANTSKISIYIEEFNSNLTEVKITLYEGSETTTTSRYGSKNSSVNESMIYDAEIYNQWFNNLRAEIERRRALTE